MPIKTKTTLSKVRKQITKKRTHKDGAGAVHENSRDHKRLNRAQIRDERLQQMSRQRSKVKRPEIDRLRYFKYSIEDEIAPLNLSEIKRIIEGCIHRDDEELDELKAARRNRPSSTREDLLRMRVKQEEEEYRTGFKTPDLMDMSNILRLKNWDESLAGMNVIKFVRIRKDQEEPKADAEMEMEGTEEKAEGTAEAQLQGDVATADAVMA
ncbi:hypothetical protein BJ508DRAFT_417723 [Ascobolus immersus RN42]|uniref:Translation machinery-associated protein 16 n=1 Tax=Ascobolus immersus RN42 TaxID=1160509 RepID=A0A3N4HVR3_ASCIM|nr:hypothetical protein BJ508DRAFT_417723 [Ascobolus immersus RN42]